MVGSTEFPLIWKEKATPAGRSISRLAPSMRRTSDSGSIGWPTPNVAKASNDVTLQCSGDGRTTPNKLGWAAAITWATPMANEARLGYQHRHEGAKGTQKSLTTQVVEAAAPWSTPRVTANGGRGFGTRERMARARLEDQACGTPSGTTQNCASAPTAKRGALAPEFVFWLMGFPAEWVSCALAAMQSFRKSRPKSSAR